MKKALLMICLMAFLSIAMAADRKPLRQVSIDEFIVECQPVISNVGDDQLLYTWWIPCEYWKVFFARDATMSEMDKKMAIDVLENVSLLGVAKADVSQFGAVDFHSKIDVSDHMDISYRNADNRRQKILPMRNIDPDIDMLLRSITPMLSNIMGEMGENLHFYVLDDRSGNGRRIIDPYKSGELTLQFTGENNRVMTGIIEMPLDTLHVPRKCLNGRNAHISWKFCPWTGTKLDD